MNYIAEIKAFYDRIELNPLPAAAISLWHALMSVANKSGWQNEFTAAQSALLLKSGLSTSSFKRARDRLAEDGFIEWEQRGGNMSAKYRITSLIRKNEPQSEPQTGPQSEPQTGPQSEPQSGPQSEPQTGPQSEPQSEPQTGLQNEPDFQNGPQTGPQSEPQSGPQTGPINKHKHIHKHKKIPPIEQIQDFISAYPKYCNRYLTETAYVDLILDGKVTEGELVKCAQNYAESCRIQETPEMYIKNAENFLKDFVFEKYLPEKYEKPVKATVKKGKDNNNFERRKYDYGDLESQLLEAKGG